MRDYCGEGDKMKSVADETDRNNISTGNAGEYFVAGELERKGFTCAVPMSNTKDFDILAIGRRTNNQYAIQVKTTRGKKKEWTLSEKNETLIADNIIYVFVTLNEQDYPEYHIVPSKIVAEKIKEDHKEWSEKLGRNGVPHNSKFSMRKFRDLNDEYRNNWGLLK